MAFLEARWPSDVGWESGTVALLDHRLLGGEPPAIYQSTTALSLLQVPLDGSRDSVAGNHRITQAGRQEKTQEELVSAV